MKSTDNDKIAKANKLMNGLLAGITVLIVVIGTAAGIRNYTDSRKMDLSCGYEAADYISGDPLETAASAKASAFAEQLCTGAGDIPLGDITFADQEKAGLFRLDGSRILYAKGIYDRIYPASITKS